MKTILITGATDGIGLATAKSLVEEGHQLLIHGRNTEKLTAAKEQLLNINAQAKVTCYCADLANLAAVDSLIDEISTEHSTLDVIINNAGVFKASQPINDTGMDVRFVVNTLAPYKITTKLQSLLSSNGRIINLSSAAQAPINFAALQGKEHIADDFQAYAQSKLAITIWSQELAKTLTDDQVIVAVNPGSLLASKMVKEGFGLAGNDISIGSDILVKAALSEDFKNASGKYYDNDSKQFILPHVDAQQDQVCTQVMTTVQSLFI